MARKTRGVTRRLIAVPRHVVLAGRNAINESLATAKNIIGRTFDGVVRVGNTTAGHLDAGVSELVNIKRSSRKSRKSRKTRKSRK